MEDESATIDSISVQIPADTDTVDSNDVIMSRMMSATSDLPNNKLVSIARSAAAKAAIELFPEDTESKRDDRLREAMTMFLARTVSHATESAVGTAFSSAPLNLSEKMNVVMEAMALMNTFPGLTGAEKKQAVVRTLTNIVKSYQPDISQIELDDVGNLAAQTVEVACDARRGRLDGAKIGTLAADAVVTSCLNGWCIPKKTKKE